MAKPEHHTSKALREAAKLQGHRRYNSGQPCMKGHHSDRYVINNRCVECDNISCRAVHKSYNQRYERTRKHKLRTLYGITPADFDAMMVNQQNKCAVCSTEFVVRKDAQVDHDHTTGQVRSLLCVRCNMGIGYFREDPALLLEAVQYLANHRR